MKIIMTCFKIAMRVSRNCPGEYSFEANYHTCTREIQISLDFESITLPNGIIRKRNLVMNSCKHEPTLKAY